ncbi:MAG: hypothetical protein M3Y87_08990 [Myxococcota bacterium]|nr:hypothetical protein [Myxococcota bacterium]
MLRTIRRWAHHPAVNVFVGLIMIVAAIGEMAGEVLGDALGLSFGAGHGLFAVGLLHTLKAIPELAEGVERVESTRHAVPPAE